MQTADFEADDTSVDDVKDTSALVKSTMESVLRDDDDLAVAEPENVSYTTLPVYSQFNDPSDAAGYTDCLNQVSHSVGIDHQPMPRDIVSQGQMQYQDHHASTHANIFYKTVGAERHLHKLDTAGRYWPTASSLSDGA